jgi:Hydrazine synthase alpha subunit middle domain
MHILSTISRVDEGMNHMVERVVITSAYDSLSKEPRLLSVPVTLANHLSTSSRSLGCLGTQVWAGVRKVAGLASSFILFFVVIGAATLSSDLLAGHAQHTPEPDTEPPVLEVRLVEHGGSAGPIFLKKMFLCVSDDCKEFAPDLFESYSPAVSRAGTIVAFVGRHGNGDKPTILVAASDGADMQSVTQGNGDPDNLVLMGDDGIIYSDYADGAGKALPGHRALFVIHKGDASPERLTYGDWLDRPVARLNTGQLVFERRDPEAPDEEKGRLLLIRPDGTGVMAAEPFYHVPPEPPSEDPSPSTGEPKTIESIFVRPSGGSRLLSMVDRKKTSGTLLCLSVYTMRPGDAPFDRGAVREVIVTVPGQHTGDPDRVFRTPVMKDGSFFLEVPADVPLSMVLLGSEGQPLRNCGRDLWVRPNENRGCIGCHEPGGQAPTNRFPEALRSPAAPIFIPSGRDDE